MPNRAIPAVAAIVLALGVAMLSVAIYGALAGEGVAAREFGTWGSVLLGLGIVAALALRGIRQDQYPRADLLVLLFFWIVAPLLAAPPVLSLVPEIGLVGAYFEMVSGFSTTGGTLIEGLDARPRSLLLWRSLSQWLGGLATLVGILVVLAPRRLGTYGLEGISEPSVWATAQSRGIQGGIRPRGNQQLFRVMLRIVPFYTLFTGLVFVGYASGGMHSFEAANFAMTTISTGGFTTRDEGIGSFGSWSLEAIAMVGMFLGAMSIGFYERIWRWHWVRIGKDIELRLFVFVVAASASALFVQHAANAHEVGRLFMIWEAMRTMWTEVFLVVSLLTTTGFATGYEGAGSQWSGMEIQSVLLFGLAAIGGGVASTAGGIRLRCVALLLGHCFAEIGKIGQPRRVRGRDRQAHRQADVRLAWITAMLFVFSISTGMLAISFFGMGFEESMTAAISSLSNAGPLYTMASQDIRAWARVPMEAQLVCCALMVLGRIGLLALVALLRTS